MFLAIYNFWQKKNPANSRESLKTSGQASSIEISLAELEEAETKIMPQATKDGNAVEQEVRVFRLSIDSTTCKTHNPIF